MKPRITPAAVAAAMRGDLENFIAATTPGGIEAQEACGQQQFVNSSTLPKRCIGCTREQIEALDIIFGEDVDDLFVRVTLPAGWSIVPTDHSMWSKLIDERGRERAAMFYKAAFYDRDAHISLSHCIRITRRWYDETNETDAAVLCANGNILFETGRVGRRDWDAVDKIEQTAHAWADEHYPDHKNPLAYW